MNNDEKEIRDLTTKWMAATTTGDIDTLLNLMTEDVVFLVPGEAPMRKADFAKAAAVQVGKAAPKFDGVSDIQEVTVQGDWAFMWTKLRVTVSPPNGDPIVRSGYTLSVLRKQHGKWLLARDANMLAPDKCST